ncbi:hypothetical protein ABZZ46_24000 [Streptomyces rochei]|uniref:hypothetical protein n=1 Tax=Streptomyces rochei TaxID=1928 RepID=UPI0033AD824A
MTDVVPEQAPSDYRLLIPRDWFRIDLTQERWRSQLKVFVDKECSGGRTSAEVTRSIWITLRNTAESGVSAGALEFFLRTEVPEGATAPASLLVSWPPMPRGMAPAPEEFAEAMTERAGPEAEVKVVDLPAGPAVRLRGESSLDYHVRMPGEAGYLHLAFSLPLSGTEGPMGRLCDAMAHSLRWI